MCGPEGQAGQLLGLHEVGRTGQQEQQQQKRGARPKESGTGGLGNSSPGGPLDGVGDQVALVGSEGVRPQPSLGCRGRGCITPSPVMGAATLTFPQDPAHLLLRAGSASKASQPPEPL